jgi:hypothetical protein
MRAVVHANAHSSKHPVAAVGMMEVVGLSGSGVMGVEAEKVWDMGRRDGRLCPVRPVRLWSAFVWNK